MSILVRRSLKTICSLVLAVLAGCQAPDISLMIPNSTESARQPLSSTPTLPTPAFPGAEGFGAKSRGGRFGRVIEVTNLNDSGPGSLRSAIEASEPRIVVFRVGGTIELDSSLTISHPYITIAGQTAPGGGITLKGSTSNTEGALVIQTHDVIVRYIRSRPGPPDSKSENGDAIEILGGAYHVMIDHCSFSWAIDEVASIWYDAHDITIQWSIIAEGLHCSKHVKGCHSMGLLIGSEGARNISIHHNLLAHNHERNPLIETSGLVDFVNNVIYNAWGTPVLFSDDYGRVSANLIGNYRIDGPNSEPGKYWVGGQATRGYGVEIYMSGNMSKLRSANLSDQNMLVKPGLKAWIVAKRFNATNIAADAAFAAYERVLSEAGATSGLDEWGKFYPRRDRVDQRIVEDVKMGTGKIIDDPSEVGGWPSLDMGTPLIDSDHDGMPDAWEKQFGFDPANPADGSQDADNDGYTNLEEYLNSTSPLE